MQLPSTGLSHSLKSLQVDRGNELEGAEPRVTNSDQQADFELNKEYVFFCGAKNACPTLAHIALNVTCPESGAVQAYSVATALECCPRHDDPPEDDISYEPPETNVPL